MFLPLIVDIQIDLEELMGENFEMLRRSLALFLLKMKEQHKISQKAVDKIVFIQEVW